ncbi:MAG: hypothetical protein ABL907_24235 [Hyphomicrobium sp.]
MKPLSYIGPFLSIAMLTVLAALPWGLPTEDRFFLPMLPVVAIHYWALRRPEFLPEWFVFLSGLLLDIFTHGPLGYWPLVYLAAYTLGIAGGEAGAKGIWMRLALFAVSLGVVAVAGWAVASVYFLEFADWGPYVRGAWLAAGAAFVIMPLLHFIDTTPAVRDLQPLTRGG